MPLMITGMFVYDPTIISSREYNFFKEENLILETDSSFTMGPENTKLFH